ncbi:non-ribosomal peptide synthetase [Streptomyces sp. NBC_00654]|uniref:non-ribosomal peptide synthetase n=1 Tax=Streptomyces sp. NBC_00654 TaxID=2975799 RepID=UPI002B1D9870|nr:non-ribosomal peptide synthetase [Streptomyces sp. NBC_00654]
MPGSYRGAVDGHASEERAVRAGAVGEFSMNNAEPGCVHELFDHRATQSPEAVAVRSEGMDHSYASLRRASDSMAAILVGKGVLPGDVVAVACPRSFDLIAGMLGILKAGAAYLPIEQELPDARVRGMLRTAGARVVLTGGAGAERTWADFGVAEVPAGERTPRRQAPGVAVSPAIAAYVLFTSGSTGKPKGVVYPHAGAVNRLRWLQETYGLRPGDRVLQKTPYGFDVSFWEFFWPLSVGATLVFASAGDHRDPARVAALIRDERITVAHFVPSVLRIFLDQKDVAEFTSSLRHLFASGEALSPELAEAVHQKLGIRVDNQYGPTESGECTWWTYRENHGHASTPIGEAVPGFRTYVLDEHLSRVPDGEAGELFLGGDGNLAHGYLGEPVLTAEKFLPDPFGSPGERMYRTGDRVRHDPEAGLLYLGRTDSQLKLHGNRIETGEVETALRKLPGVREAAVKVVPDETGGQLVAYVLTDFPFSPGDARRLLAETLVAAAVPSHYVVLDEFPVNRNGKLDRDALPVPALDAEAGNGAMDGASELHVAVAEVWAGVTGRSPASIDQEFLDAGGNSLKAVQLVGRLRRLTGLDLTVEEFFTAGTVRSIATVLEHRFENLDSPGIPL